MSTTTVFVYTLNGGRGKWSRYGFPFAIESFTQLGNDLFIRHGDFVNKVSEDAVTDEVDGEEVEFGGTVWWPWLDFGQPGVSKSMLGFDLVASGTPSISIGFDQRDVAALTTPYELPGDTLPDGYFPLEVTAPTLSVKLTFAGGERWTLNEVLLYLNDNAVTT